MKLTNTLKRNFALGLGATVLATSMAILNPGQIHAATVTVKAGDTVSELASTYKTSIAAIEKANGIGANHLILVGQQLNIGATSGTSKQVTVKAGDTVSGLASEYGSSISAIETTNNIVGHLILVGQVITIPTANTTVAPAQTATTTQSASTSTASTQSSTASVAKAAPATATKSTTSTATSTVVSGSEASAKATIAQRESGGSYTARNGQYIGKYQLTSSYLGGDYSAANQERVANNYVASRYGSWTKALAFWNANGWY
ncbi:LysM peptidoglycan-binding domain-containing protein [Lapidilactobacillus mulanensis]|uniref:LysM peptidoglycan-binding domain-containing protein n=1 Tax=Lapidilactobacillus mulanensis TaxID=2485999 RepID=A0ABW4DRU0_9LACO|nr:LysM peptidoglycan-binding domain-containing protein [Lapidilactobacillus mulanensis]